MSFAGLRSKSTSPSPSSTRVERAPAGEQALPIPALTAESLREELGRFAVDVIRPEIVEATTRLELAVCEQLNQLLKAAEFHVPEAAKAQEDTFVSDYEEDELHVGHSQHRAPWIGRLRAGVTNRLHNRGSEPGLQQLLPVGMSSSTSTRRMTRARITRARATLPGPAAGVAGRTNARTLEAEFADAPLSERQVLCGASWMHQQDEKHWCRDEADSDADPAAWVPRHLNEFALDIVEHSYFDFGCATAILINLLVIGWEADWALKPQPEEMKLLVKDADLFFCLLFSAELALRICAYGTSFFTGDKKWWNMFDFTLVMLQLLDQISARLYSQDTENFNFSFLRFLNAVKNIRVLRTVRMCRFITELRILLVVIGGSFRATFWTIVLLLLVTYSFSITIMILIRARVLYEPMEASLAKEVGEYFGSITRTMWTLYLAISGGIEWYLPESLLHDNVSPIARPFFGCYMAFMVFVFLNIITGIFLNTALSTTEDLKQHNIMAQIKRIFDEGDVDKSGDICFDEFNALIQDREMEIYMRSLGWRMEQATELFALLDADEDGTINVNEFVEGCHRLQGPVKAVDFASFACDIENAVNRVFDRVEHVERMISNDRKANAQPPQRFSSVGTRR